MGVQNSRCFKRKDFRLEILMLGLNGAGKTTIANSLVGSTPEYTEPTFAPTCHSGTNLSQGLKGHSVWLWDFSGDERIRHDAWPNLVREPQVLMFVVDSSDVARITEARQYLSGVLQSPNVVGIPVLILANKQDLPGALSPPELAEKLFPQQHTANPLQVQGACAVTGEGLGDIIHKLAEMAHAA